MEDRPKKMHFCDAYFFLEITIYESQDIQISSMTER